MLSEPLVDTAEKKLILSNIFTFFELDLYTAKVTDLTFAHKYELRMNRNDTVHALACWFDTYFTNLENPIKLSTSPYSTTTHWKQTIFYLNNPIKVKTGQNLTGSIAVKRNRLLFRDLDIKISYHHNDEASSHNYCQLYKLRWL